jgi:hypothetical protein
MTISRAMVLGFALLVGCSGLTDVDAPDLVKPSDLDTPSGAVARYAGALSRFANAFQEQVTQTGVLTDEFWDVGGGVFPADRRSLAADNSPYPFDLLSLARIDALRAAASLQRFSPEPAGRIGEMYALAGFVEVMFAEDLCAPIPLATVEDGLPRIGPVLSREQLLQAALAHFDSAETFGTPGEGASNLARVGRGRALLSMDDIAGAAAAVAAVPLPFVYRIEYSGATDDQSNGVYDRIAINRILSVSDREGINGLPFVSGSDTRIGADTLGISRAGLPLITFANSESLGSPIVLASGVEAALIRAEAALSAGDIEAWADSLNRLRNVAINPAVPPLSEDSTIDANPAVRVDVLFKERAFWLYATGHRQGDVRRLVRQYGRPADSVLPTGAYPYLGLEYGGDVTFAPRGEGVNPEFRGCKDRGA